MVHTGRCTPLHRQCIVSLLVVGLVTRCNGWTTSFRKPQLKQTIHNCYSNVEGDQSKSLVEHQEVSNPVDRELVVNYGSFNDVNINNRRTISLSLGMVTVLMNIPFSRYATIAFGETNGDNINIPGVSAALTKIGPVDVSVSGDVKKLFNEGRALESQGNIAAAQRLYEKVTKIAPRFVYGWSNLGNTQTAFGDLNNAEKSYNIAIDLCNENLQESTDDSFGVKRCSDLYILLLNRGSLRLNTGMPKEALDDLRQAEVLRGRPDAIILQNLARAYEINGLYKEADYDYTTSISMTANEVNPFWIRSALVKFQLGDIKGGYDLFKRVAIRFPEAPEVRAAYAVFLLEVDHDMTAAQQKYLEIPDRQRLKFVNREYLTKTICWPPAMIDRLNKITSAVGDNKRESV
jgi:tetratricopeptide (TPR) repeat protein